MMGVINMCASEMRQKVRPKRGNASATCRSGRLSACAPPGPARSRETRLASWVLGALGAIGCGSDETALPAAADGFPLPPGTVFATVAQLDTPDGASTLVSFTPEVPSGELEVGSALELPGFASV